MDAQLFPYQNLTCVEEVDTAKHDGNLNTLLTQNYDLSLFCERWRQTQNVAIIVDYRSIDTTYVYDFDPLGVIGSINYYCKSELESVILEFNSKGQLERVHLSQPSAVLKDLYINHHRVVSIRDHLAREGTREYKSFSRIPKDVLRMYNTCLEHYEKNMGRKLECSIR
jgi:hypothetical protein